MEKIFCFLELYLSSTALASTLSKMMRLERSRYSSSSVRRACSQTCSQLALLISCFNRSVLQNKIHPLSLLSFPPHTGYMALHDWEVRLCPTWKRGACLFAISLVNENKIIEQREFRCKHIGRYRRRTSAMISVM